MGCFLLQDVIHFIRRTLSLSMTVHMFFLLEIWPSLIQKFSRVRNQIVCAFVSYHNKLHVCDIISKYIFYWLKKTCIISLVSVFPILSKNFWMTGIEFNTRGLCWHQYNSNISECYTCSTMNLAIFFMIILILQRIKHA